MAEEEQREHTGPRAYTQSFVQYFLDRCDHTQNRIPFYCRTIIIEQIIIEQTVSSMYYYR